MMRTLLIALLMFAALLTVRTIPKMERLTGDQYALAVQQTNSHRARLGLPALQRHPTLDRAAQDFANYLARSPGTYKKWAHRADGQTPSQRARAIGYQGCVGENLYKGWQDAMPANLGAEAAIAFINSPPHEANIRDPGFREIGTGIAYIQSGGLWYYIVIQALGDGLIRRSC